MRARERLCARRNKRPVLCTKSPTTEQYVTLYSIRARAHTHTTLSGRQFRRTGAVIARLHIYTPSFRRYFGHAFFFFSSSTGYRCARAYVYTLMFKWGFFLRIYALFCARVPGFRVRESGGNWVKEKLSCASGWCWLVGNGNWKFLCVMSPRFLALYIHIYVCARTRWGSCSYIYRYLETCMNVIYY